MFAVLTAALFQDFTVGKGFDLSDLGCYILIIQLVKFLDRILFLLVL